MDGSSFSITVPEHTRVSEFKHAICTLHGLAYFAVELFTSGTENALVGEMRLRALLKDGAKPPLFMLLKCPSDEQALAELFKTASGTHWYDTTGWLATEAAVADRFGVVVCMQGRVTELVLQDNFLAGAITTSIVQLSALQVLDLQGNQLTGPIPAELGKLTALTVLDLYDNILCGVIPAELGQLGALSRLCLGENQLTGRIPAELGRLAMLGQLFLENNQLSGSIPAELGKLQALSGLYLQGNQLSGSIPAELRNLQTLVGLNLSNNRLTGPIPSELGLMTALDRLFLENNQLSGKDSFQRHLREHNRQCNLKI